MYILPYENILTVSILVRNSSSFQKSSSKVQLSFGYFPHETDDRGQHAERLAWNDVLTLTWLNVAQLKLLLLVGQLGYVLLTEESVEVPLVPGVRDAHQDGEEEEGEDGLPDLDLAGGGPHQDDDKPEVGEDGEGRRDAKYEKVLNPEIILKFIAENRKWSNQDFTTLSVE